MDIYIAHYRKSDGAIQTVSEHLFGTAVYARNLAKKIGLPDVGELLGLLHDMGKYPRSFQSYIRSGCGILNVGDKDYIDVTKLKTKIDHSSAGAQILWKALSVQEPEFRLIAKVLSICLLSHHSGLINSLSVNGDPTFLTKINKSLSQTNFDEVVVKCDIPIKDKIDSLLSNPDLPKQLLSILKSIKAPDGRIGRKIRIYKIGQLVRFLFSCLIDADRTDTCIFEKPYSANALLRYKKTDWKILIDRLETKLSEYQQNPNPKPIDNIRSEISEHCKIKAKQNRGIFTLTVPTGGGKTLASLRFALLHAEEHKLDRIIYVVPFTTIIDQNADEVRKILEPKTEPYSSIVLEHHSNLTPDEESWRGKFLSENWNAPVIFTTSVQLLETLFSSGTKNVRRMHQLANSMIIFDEIQTLPIKCTHMFNNSINFLVETCGSSAILCTATQPLLNKVDPEKGACNFNENSEIIPDVKKLFDVLNRVTVLDIRKKGGYSNSEIAEYAINEMKNNGNCLIIVNTKKSAYNIYKIISKSTPELVYHLSTDLCPSHRRFVLDKVRKSLSEKIPHICVSTQLIEAGVDIDFGSVIRCLAGIDSIAQAAGRCNRHGIRKSGRVIIMNSRDENLYQLTDIEKGKSAAERVLNDLIHDPLFSNKNLLSPPVLERFFIYYYYNRKSEMNYPIYITEKNGIDRNDNILDLLSDNPQTIKEYFRKNNEYPEDLNLNHSFATAGKIFKAIDAPTRGVIVPFGEKGSEVINELCSTPDIEKQYRLLKKAQQFSVNLFPWRFDLLQAAGALFEVKPDTGIYHLDKKFYDDDFGISNEPVI